MRLERARVADAEAVAVAVGESLDHLRPWMPWATEEAATVEGQREYLGRAQGMWEEGTDFGFVLRSGGPEVLGTCGLHRRVGPRAIEIGYWLHPDHTGHGLITTAARALGDVALALPDVDRLEIHCDEANHRSAAVPRRLGYRLDRVEDDGVEAPGESGRGMVWVTA